MFEIVIGQTADGQPDVTQQFMHGGDVNRTALLLLLLLLRLLLHVCGCWFPLPGCFRHCNRRESTANMAHATRTFLGWLPVCTSLQGSAVSCQAVPTSGGVKRHVWVRPGDECTRVT